mmetsp:Transcript_27567/g.22799  ORF Transcript_27567/g.22799 Transcript_27567/m.22799 type:complete len:82 (+) Transcript_27567:290-535(+)
MNNTTKATIGQRLVDQVSTATPSAGQSGWVPVLEQSGHPDKNSFSVVVRIVNVQVEGDINSTTDSISTDYTILLQEPPLRR